MEPREVAQLLGRRIRALRKAKGLTQEGLGDKSSINYKYLGAVERGEENPSLSTLQKIADGLEVDILELFRFHHEETDQAKLKKELVGLINQIEKEEGEKLGLILRLVKALR
jgi:transcriptional regulator with XRE-family HTH domain